MRIERKGLKITAGLLLVGTFLVLQRFAALPKAPAIALESAAARPLFRLDFALPDLHDHRVRLSDLPGKVVLLGFAANRARLEELLS